MAFNRARGKMTYHRRKICRFCADSSLVIDYKDFRTLKYFTTERGKNQLIEKHRINAVVRFRE